MSLRRPRWAAWVFAHLPADDSPACKSRRMFGPSSTGSSSDSAPLDSDASDGCHAGPSAGEQLPSPDVKHSLQQPLRSLGKEKAQGHVPCKESPVTCPSEHTGKHDQLQQCLAQLQAQQLEIQALRQQRELDMDLCRQEAELLQEHCDSLERRSKYLEGELDALVAYLWHGGPGGQSVLQQHQRQSARREGCLCKCRVQPDYLWWQCLHRGCACSCE
jgi:hypothetical protein